MGEKQGQIKIRSKKELQRSKNTVKIGENHGQKGSKLEKKVKKE